jgi:hypothetical protein
LSVEAVEKCVTPAVCQGRDGSGVFAQQGNREQLDVNGQLRGRR